MKQNQLVSVIVPIYKVEKYLSQGIESIINQTYKNLEIILVDDGSPDNCGRICDEYAEKDSRVKVIHKKNGGVSSARNAGIEAANGEWIYFMDPDDWIELDLVEKAVEYAIENDVDMCMFDYDRVFNNRKIRAKALNHEGNVFKDLNDLELFCAYICAMGNCWNFVTKAYVIKQLWFDVHLKYGEDQIFKSQLYFTISSFAYIRNIMYHYRIIESSATNVTLKNDFFYICKNLVTKYMDVLSGNNYPNNSEVAIYTKFLNNYGMISTSIFDSPQKLKEKKYQYNNYINSDIFKNALKNYNPNYLGRFVKLCIKNGKAPNWLTAYILVKMKKIYNNFFKNPI